MQNADAPSETLLIDDDEPPSGRLDIHSFYPAQVPRLDPIHLTRPVFILPAKKPTSSGRNVMPATFSA